MHYTGSHIIRLQQTTGIGSIQKYTPNKIISGTCDDDEQINSSG